jgi:short-subunit dehydrogenase
LWAVINNAGIAEAIHSDFCPIESYRKSFEVNFFAVVRIVKQLLPYLKMTKDSRIINISSVAGLVGGQTGTIYAG